MSVRSAQSVTTTFTTTRVDSGAATNADSTPTGVLYVNGTADAATVTVTNLATGVYKAAVTLPTLAVGDVVNIVISATVNSIAGKGKVWEDTKDVFAGALPDVIAGGAGGLLIAGSNAATTLATLTVSGAVAFQSTFAVTTSTSLAALSCTTLTASGAVAFQSTFAVTTSTNLAALSCSMFAASGTVTFNAFTVTNALTVSGTTTLTGAVTASNASNNIVGITLGTTQVFNNTGTWTGNIVGTLSTLTTYTGNTVQTGDSFARIGVAGVGLTNIQLPSNGLANVTTWTVAITGNVSGSVGSVTGLTVATIDTQLSSTHGAGAWSTATGFAVAGDTMRQDMTQAVPASNTAQTLGDALNAARAIGFGKLTIVGSTLTLYAADGTTVVRTFTLAVAPGDDSRV